MKQFLTNQQLAKVPPGSKLWQALVERTDEGGWFETRHAVFAPPVPQQGPRGLGDTIARVTAILRLDRLAHATARLLGRESCECERRREWLNRKVPYGTGTPPRDDPQMVALRPPAVPVQSASEAATAVQASVKET
jgi:hypothetical protein